LPFPDDFHPLCASSSNYLGVIFLFFFFLSLLIYLASFFIIMDEKKKKLASKLSFFIALATITCVILYLFAPLILNAIGIPLSNPSC
jgi:fatty acid desaturase